MLYFCHRYVQLEDTVLFPEGGGQPGDVGTIAGAVVLDSQNVDGYAVHTVDTALEPGSEVEVKLDWTRRFDNMQQHSAQHLLTALAIKKWGYQTAAWNLGEEVSFLDLDTQSFTPDERVELEMGANEAIRAGYRVAPRWIEVSDPEMQSIRCRGLPDNVVGAVRVLEIDGVDQNLCCGTHVKSTTDIQFVKVLKVERAKDCQRLYFIAGNRVTTQLQAMFDREQEITGILSKRPENHVAEIERMAKTGRDADKFAKALSAEVASLTAEKMASEAAAGASIIAYHRRVGDLDFLRTVASALDAACPGTLVLGTAGTGVGDAGCFMLSGPTELVVDWGPKFAAAMDGKGGGKGRYQGKVAKLHGRNKVLEDAKRELG